MQLEYLINKSISFLENTPGNYVSEEDAIRPDLAGMKIFDDPIFGVASSDDPLFSKLKETGVVGGNVFLPKDWIDDAKSVISYFLPFTEQVRRANASDLESSSDEWLHARIEGQKFNLELSQYIIDLIRAEGFSAVCPAKDSRFRMIATYASNWSERHVAHICGLGTFGLSKGLITRKGMAGRFSSIITSAPLSVTERAYTDPFEYCIMCGKCQTNCPVNAIDVKKGVAYGKDHVLCDGFLTETKRPPHGPNNISRYGCGKCQVDVPCEYVNPL